MAVDSNTRLVRSLSGKDGPSQVPKVERRQGEVVSVQGDGSATVTIGGDPETVAGVASYTSYTPVALDTVELEVQDTEVTIIGKLGTAVSPFSGIQEASVAAAETRSNTAFGDLTTAGPAVTVTVSSSGMLLVQVASDIKVTSSSDGGRMGFDISGASTVAANDQDSLKYEAKVSNAELRASRVVLVTGLNPGATTVTAKYRSSPNNSGSTYTDRNIWVLPL